MVVYTQEYAAPVDIVNRALQHIGQTRIATLDEDSKAAAEAKFAYDKVRVAELQRNKWTFAMRRAALRAIDTSTRILTPIAYNAATVYSAGALATYDGEIWQTRFALNPGTTPGSSNTAWDLYCGPLTAAPVSSISSTNTFFAGELVWQTVLSVNYGYVSLINDNDDDVNTAASWTGIGTPTLAAATVLYPLGAGPVSQASSRNAYRLPNGFLRHAPQGQRVGDVYRDWEFDDQFLLTADTGTIPLRFVADISNVARFDAMFCEGLAARLAMSLCEPLSQSSEKFKVCAALYKTLMGEARIINSIESGPTEPAEDDYIACRA